MPRLNLPSLCRHHSNSAADRSLGAAGRSDMFCMKGFSRKADKNNKIAVSATLVAEMDGLAGLSENYWIGCVIGFV